MNEHLNPVNPHLGPASSFFGAPVRSARVVVILIHGRGQSPADMERELVRRIDLPDVAYVAPAAAGNSWYPAPFMSPLADNQPRLTFALERIAALSDQLSSEGVPLAEQVVMGFSQGACLGSEYVYRRRQRFGALIALTGGMIGPHGTAWDADTDVHRDMPVLIEGGSADTWVPASRMLETAELYRRLGARVGARLYPSLGHVISDEQIEHARAVLLEVRRGGPDAAVTAVTK